MTANAGPSIDDMLERERIANKRKHWVRAVTACNSRCLFCLDSDTPRNVYLPEEEVKAEIDRGRDELDAEKIIISGGEASLHPKFPEFIEYAVKRGYDRVQTVTNGYRFSDRAFFRRCMDAGLGEITFSLHGHTAELHDDLTQLEGSFRRLIKGMARAVRDGRPIVNVDICINKQNVAVIDKIVELCMSLGVYEFDLLHIIPQAAAFDNRHELFYDVRDHLPTLQKVFRLNRHPRVVVWTNRFPVSYLEGLEDLIQDPHKMLDEVNGRRFQVRRYLDTGEPLDCRDKERCPHCFIEPFCTTLDRTIAGQNQRSFQIWWLGSERWQGEELPFGCDTIGLRVRDFAELASLSLPEGVNLYLGFEVTEPIPPDFFSDRVVTLIAESAAQLDEWFDSPEDTWPEHLAVEIRLNQDTGAWLLAHRDRVAGFVNSTGGDRVSLRQPSHEHMASARQDDIREPRVFFARLGIPLAVSGLPVCLAPGMRLVAEPRILPRSVFDRETGRLHIRRVAERHVAAHYRAKSVRCADCAVNDRCEGAHINMIRDQGLGQLTPLDESDPHTEAAIAQLTALFPTPRPRLATGREVEPVAQSLPGFAEPTGAPADPLALIGAAQIARRTRRRRAINKAGGG